MIETLYINVGKKNNPVLLGTLVTLPKEGRKEG